MSRSIAFGVGPRVDKGTRIREHSVGLIGDPIIYVHCGKLNCDRCRSDRCIIGRVRWLPLRCGLR